MTTSQIWTGILVVASIIFMSFQTFLRIKKRNKILPLLRSISGGPTYSTKVGSEGIILPALVYNSGKLTGNDPDSGKTANSENKLEIKTHPHQSEILDVYEMIENTKKKFIHEEGQMMTSLTSSKENQQKVTLSEEDPQDWLLSPLEAAYKPSKVVSEVWSSHQSGVNHLYRYSNLDRLIYPPGYLFQQNDSII